MLPKLLCVDDEPSILSSLERLLKSHFQVLTTGSPHVALKLLKLNPDCAVVLSDFRMPEMNGVDLLKQVRLLNPLTSRAILSGQIDLQIVSEAINNSDIHKLFLKPWENEYLFVQMLEAVQLHNTLSEKAHYEHLSITDPVTQLSNHRFFQDHIRKELNKAKLCNEVAALIIIDVDFFKIFNDRFGHPEGDRLLYAVAQQLKKLVEKEGIVSRYGGEEFTIILPRYDYVKALALAEHVRSNFEKNPFTGLTSSPTYITISAGVAVFPENGSEAHQIIDCADRALYQAKRQGRNQVVIAPIGGGPLRR